MVIAVVAVVPAGVPVAVAVAVTPVDVLLLLVAPDPSPVTSFFEGGRVSQTLHRASKTLFDST